MLYIYHGTNTSKSSDKARTLVDSLRAKKPDAAFVLVNSDNWNSTIIDEHLGGQGLFSNKYIIFLDRVAVEDEIKEKLVEMLPVMKESQNIFIVSEGKVNAELTKAFEKHGDKIVMTDESVLGVKAGASSGWGGEAGAGFAKKEFNIFSLADALGARDRFKAWSIYRQAIQNGLESESILGTLFWQVKSMVLASGAKSAGESGLNPFVFSKAKKYSANYSGQELKGLLERLIILYHDGHRGLVDLELGTEKFLLKI
jgi:DNA polymerase III delta subunit